MTIRDIDFYNEFDFTTSRSSGAGGQHVNKVNTQVELRFDVNESGLLTPEHKERILKKLENRITKDGILVLQCSESRSQHRNKEICIDKFYDLMEEALTEQPKRKKTKPSKQAKRRRLEKKRKHAEKKARRRKDKRIDF